jgi:hypothetical protein
MIPSSLISVPFELENVPPQADEAELLALLSERIEEMLERRPEYLMSLLYRLDVLEEKIRPVMRPRRTGPTGAGTPETTRRNQANH